jgi:hypothetical protein
MYNINNLKKQIEHAFLNETSYKYITINNKLKTKEISNFEYCLVPEHIEAFEKPPVEEELDERSFILKRSLKVTDLLLNDINSRQATFVNNYDGADNHCISYIHHYVRDNKYCINAYTRSMNFDRNFVFDNQTFNIIYSFCFNILKNKYENLEKGYIRNFVFSLHRYED